MNRPTFSQLVARVLILLVGATALDRWVISRWPGLTEQQGQVLLVLLMMIAAGIFIVPIAVELIRALWKYRGR